MKKLCLMAALLLSICLVSAETVHASAADFYKGKTVFLVVPYKAGGGTDAFARMVGLHLGRYLGATVVIKNMPGGGGTYAYNTLYNAKPDGLTIAITDTGGMALSQLLQLKGVQYDFRKFNWLGRASYSKRVVLVGKDSPYKTLDDIKAAKRISVSGTGKTDSGSLTWVLLANAIGLKPGQLNMVVGYGSGKELMMAVMQGEVDTTSLTEDTSAKFVKGGLVRALVTVDEERAASFPNVPTVYEEEKISQQEGWPLAFYLSLEKLRRGFIAPPGLEQDKVDFLRESLSNCLKDKDLLAQAKKQKVEIIPMGGAEMAKQIKEKIGSLSDQQISEFRTITLQKYYKQ